MNDRDAQSGEPPPGDTAPTDMNGENRTNSEGGLQVSVGGMTDGTPQRVHSHTRVGPEGGAMAVTVIVDD